MSPNTAWIAMCAAVADARWMEAGELADGLLDWLIKGEYPPEITGVHPFDRIVARATCESVAAWVFARSMRGSTSRPGVKPEYLRPHGYRHIIPVPLHDEISLTARRSLATRWQTIAESLGYGQRGRFKLLRILLLDFVEEN